MQIAKRRVRPLWIILIILAVCTVAWAVAELSGQANKSAADAGMAAADFEMASFETIKPSQSTPPCDWALEKKLRQEIEKIDADYKKAAAKAQGEAGAAKGVSSATKKSVLDLAKQFKDASDRYAKMWEACKCVSRARLARETGASRLASADMLVSGADSAKAKAVSKQHEKLNKARNEYVKEAVAGNELSEKDKRELKAGLMPRATQLVVDTANLTARVSALLNQAKSEAGKAADIGSGGIGLGSLGKVASVGDNSATLVKSLGGLLSLTQSMSTNAKSLVNDITALTQ